MCRCIVLSTGILLTIIIIIITIIIIVPGISHITNLEIFPQYHSASSSVAGAAPVRRDESSIEAVKHTHEIPFGD